MGKVVGKLNEELFRGYPQGGGLFTKKGRDATIKAYLRDPPSQK